MLNNINTFSWKKKEWEAYGDGKQLSRWGEGEIGEAVYCFKADLKSWSAGFGWGDNEKEWWARNGNRFYLVWVWDGFNRSLLQNWESIGSFKTDLHSEQMTCLLLCLRCCHLNKNPFQPPISMNFMWLEALSLHWMRNELYSNHVTARLFCREGGVALLYSSTQRTYCKDLPSKALPKRVLTFRILFRVRVCLLSELNLSKGG